MQCSLGAHFDGARLQTLQARLVMDAPHSSQALAVIRDPATGQLDPGRGQRFVFVLRQQLVSGSIARFWRYAQRRDLSGARSVR